MRATAPVARDAGLALSLAAASLLLGEVDQAAWPNHVVTAVPAVVALFLRRWRPLSAFALAASSTAAHVLDPTIRRLLPMDLAAVVCLYAVTAATRRRTGLVLLAGSVPVLYGLLILGSPSPNDRTGPPDRSAAMTGTLSRTVPPALLLVVAWALGDAARVRRLQLALSEQKDAELDAAAERARMSGEIHDVMAHGMSVMVVQAQAAAATLRPDPDTAAAALTHVVDTGRASLAEMRRLLGRVHGTSSAAATTPPVGVGALRTLVDEARRTGTAVELHVEGQPIPVPVAVDLSTYRIVQEALTNTRRHAGPGAHAMVRLRFAEDRLEIDVIDDGVGAAPDVARGNGLRGVAERVDAVGGTLSAGSHDGGGFRVHARLPVTGHR